MLKLSKRFEYGLCIIDFLRKAEAGTLISARTISEGTGIPFDMVTKCLQSLHRFEICRAVQGKQGGYELTCDTAALDLGQMMTILADPVNIAECLEERGRNCAIVEQCTIKGPIEKLNLRVRQMLADITLAEFFEQAAASRCPERVQAGPAD